MSNIPSNEKCDEKSLPLEKRSVTNEDELQADELDRVSGGVGIISSSSPTMHPPER